MTESDGAGAEQIQHRVTDDGVESHAAVKERETSAWLTADGNLTVPWLIVYGHGPQCQKLAEAIAILCRTRNVAPVLRELEEVDLGDLRYHRALLLVLPSAETFTQIKSAAKKVSDLITAYRLLYPGGVALLNPRTSRSYAAGVVQVLHHYDAVDIPQIRAAIDQACIARPVADIADLDAIDLFDVYQPGAVRSTSQLNATLKSLWFRLAPWGITTIEQAREIKEFIDQRRQMYEDPKRYPAMWRPVPHLDMNHLVLILEGKLDVRPADHGRLPEVERRKAETAFVDSSARAVRELNIDLTTRFPYYSRPSHRQSRKDSRKDLHDLYRILRSVTIGS